MKTSQDEKEQNMETSDLPIADPTKMLQSEQDFQSLFATIVWFLEHDLSTKVAMGLDVNFWKVNQENFKAKKGSDTDMLKAIIQKGGDTFKNSTIHLFFMKRLHQTNQSRTLRKYLH